MRLAALSAWTTIALTTACGLHAGPSRVELVWAVETPDGEQVDSNGADRSVNPASVAKLATTWWALDRLGPEHRFVTRVGVTDAGDLVVVGGGDPDFHVENAFLIARELNRAGLGVLEGRLIVTGDFWIGWEGGSARRRRDPERRAEQMADRLRKAFDPASWDVATREAIAEFEARRGWSDANRPSVTFVGGAVARSSATPTRLLVEHRSNPLGIVLKRFNAWSNNDIERLGRSVGLAGELSGVLSQRLKTDVRLDTLSGLGRNRMSPRQMLGVVRLLRAEALEHGLTLQDLLPVFGCDPGTLERFPSLDPSLRGSLTAKTGTLTTTDDGIVVLAGVAATASGDRLFAVAAPQSGADVAPARAAEARWLNDVVERAGGPRPEACPDPVVHSDRDARVSAIDQSISRKASSSRSTSDDVL